MEKFIHRQQWRSLMALGLVVGAVGAQAALIDVGNSLTVSGTIAAQDRGAKNIGYVSYGDGVAEHCYAGAFDLTVVNHSAANSTFTIGTFCTDVGVNWKNSDNYTAVGFAGQTGLNPSWSANPFSIQNVSWLYNTYYVGHTLNSDQEGGMQLAIWKVLYDTTAPNGTIAYAAFDGVGSGMFKASDFGASVMDWASTYVSDVNTSRKNQTFTAYSDTWLKPNDRDSQGLIWNANAPGLTPVPEASTMIAGALLLVPLAASALRIRRKNTSV